MSLQLPLYTGDNLYPSYLDRLLVKSLGVESGIVEPKDYEVTVGSGLMVVVNSGKAFVEQTKAIEESENSFFNGLYMVPNSTSATPFNSVEVSSANPQIAQIILRVYDVEELKISGQSYARLEWLNGTPTVNATEAKMKKGEYEGAAALPQSSYCLSYILVPKNATKSSEFYIEDARNISSQWPIKQIGAASNIFVRYGEMASITGSITATIPKAVLNKVVGAWALAGEPTIKCESSNIYGDFISAKREIKLCEHQHIIMQGNATGEWLIISGEPKQTAKWEPLVERTLPPGGGLLELTPSVSRPTNVAVVIKSGGFEGQVIAEVEGVEVARLPGVTGGSNGRSMNFRVNAGQKIELSGSVTGKVFTSYLFG